MRIAVAGGSGLGPLIAQELDNAEVANSVILLSRYQRNFPESNIQVIPVDYNNQEQMFFALQGVDLVISTITGPSQQNLIYAAGYSQVRHFVPAEFEGSPNSRQNPDVLLPGSLAARNLLRDFERSSESRMKYTVFSCGIFMERFAPTGLASYGVGDSSGVSAPGDYILNLLNHTAKYVERNDQGHSVRICLTSIYDVARFVAAAVEIGPAHWPHEYTMRGQRMTMLDLVGTCSRFLRAAFHHDRHNVQHLRNYIIQYIRDGDDANAAYFQRLLATAEGRYDFQHGDLNDLVPFRPMNLEEWLAGIYATQ